MTLKIPLSDVDLDGEEIEAVTRVVQSGWLSMGPVTEAFEEAFARYVGVRHAFGVSSCTAALHLAHRIAGITAGDEVIAPSLTFVATTNSILYCGGTPVFADICGRDDFNISPEAIERQITDRTKAITIVHYGGYPCAMDEILEIARDRDVMLIEDAAHAIGAEYRGKKCGSFGDVGCFSFFANKNLATGEGGMIVTDDDRLAGQIQVLRSHGMTTMTWDRHRGHAFSYDVLDLGYNYRLNELAAALGIVQLGKLRRNNEKRAGIVREYRRRLAELPGVSSPFERHSGGSAHHLFPVLLPEGVSRASVMERMREKGIQTSIHYPPIHHFSYYKKMFGLREGALPQTEHVGGHELTLPLYPGMQTGDLDVIIDRLACCLGEETAGGTPP
ncbi:MAG: DegT/DnrJ/EryC1/StrS family aminotransferase [Methanomicrobiaceae archaeon]|uniref:Bacillosamine/legionaminic acid biosynthesis aminotransferase pgle n=1 Tax=hydrocarbon metagenome TaxID=938273 RepID=A0A0W8FIW1_9ZZZZ|nr:DegT/DnrJ/EryC1/StrS family aminotransferase [Methanomicrobiaceae archaeon]MDD5418454.1 DegT/DnrJ/EryC1/StrS family aminotransferase [Methanomicrobiaceae archaeon]